jgi:hypothetical protein
LFFLSFLVFYVLVPVFVLHPSDHAYFAADGNMLLTNIHALVLLATIGLSLALG